jgi:MFS family permease
MRRNSATSRSKCLARSKCEAFQFPAAPHLFNLSAMRVRPSNFQGHLTLVLATLLHMFTHAYGTMLVPLYFMIRADLRLDGVKMVAFIVTLYGVTYCAFSYYAGVLADRFDRRLLLGIGLLGNAVAITLMGFTHQYSLLLGLGVVAGLFGTLFHPAANALLPAHYPTSPGMAIGLLGIGSGLGFYVGPKFSGWRAATASWQWAGMAQWQKPLVELGIAGIICAALVLLFAREAESRVAEHKRKQAPLGLTLRRRLWWISLTLGCRDFAGVSSVSLIGIYLQKAHGMSVQRTGAILGSMMLVSVFVNPLAVWISQGAIRLPVMVALLAVGGIGLAAVPFVPVGSIMIVLALFQTCHLGSYAVSDAAMLERVPGDLRGRVVGVFLSLAGTVAACGPWVMGYTTDLLGPHGNDPRAYVPVFAVTGAIMGLATVSAPFIARLGAVQGRPIEPFSEMMPGTMEPVG